MQQINHSKKWSLNQSHGSPEWTHWILIKLQSISSNNRLIYYGWVKMYSMIFYITYFCNVPMDIKTKICTNYSESNQSESLWIESESNQEIWIVPQLCKEFNVEFLSRRSFGVYDLILPLNKPRQNLQNLHFLHFILVSCIQIFVIL